MPTSAAPGSRSAESSSAEAPARGHGAAARRFDARARNCRWSNAPEAQAWPARDEDTPMRQLALLGLVVSLLLGAIAVSATDGTMHARRNEQDRSLQEAVNSETALISGGERQTTTALSLLLVNPAVRSVLDGQRTSHQPSRTDMANAATALAAIQRTAFVPVSAMCKTSAAARQLVRAPPAHPASSPEALGRQFAALARRSAVGATSGAFLSPVSKRLSVAFLAPFRSGGRMLGRVHLDIGLALTQGAGLIVNDTPGVEVQLATYEKGHGRLLLNGPTSRITANGLGSAAAVSVGAFGIDSQPPSTLVAAAPPVG